LGIAACEDTTGPDGPLTGHFSIVPTFRSQSAGVVDVETVRVLLVRASDESVVLDTTITLEPR
jgi:hypothetical protein